MTDIKGGDIVTLKDHTSLYRVYTMGKKEFIYACLNADILRTSEDAEVETIETNYVCTVEPYPSKE